MITVRNIKTGKTGTLVKKEGNRILVAYGKNRKAWGSDSNFEYLPLNNIKNCAICKRSEVFPVIDNPDNELLEISEEPDGCMICKDCSEKEVKNGEDKSPGTSQSAEVMAEKTLVNTGITCPFCKEFIRLTSDRQREVCACNLQSLESLFVTTFGKNIQSEFITDIKNPETTFIQIGERYRNICESVDSEVLTADCWEKINREIKARFGGYHLKIIHEYIASDDMPRLDPDEIAIRLAYTDRAEQKKKEPVKLRTFPKIELDAVYTLSCTVVTWKKKRRKTMEIQTGRDKNAGKLSSGTGAKIKAWLVRRNIRMSRIAEELGVSRQMVSQVIAGKCKSSKIREYLVYSLGMPHSYIRASREYKKKTEL